MNTSIFPPPLPHHPLHTLTFHLETELREKGGRERKKAADSTSFIWGIRGRMPIAPTGHKPMALFVDHTSQWVQADPPSRSSGTNPPGHLSCMTK